MRTIFITLIISLCFFGVFSYLLDNLPLFGEEELNKVEEMYGVVTQEEFDSLFLTFKESGLVLELVNKNNFYAMVISFFLFVSTTITAIHLFVDKLFFKRFYEQPSMKLAIRRSLIFSLFIFLAMILHLFALLDVLTGVLLLVPTLFIEYVFWYTKKEEVKITEEE